MHDQVICRFEYIQELLRIFRAAVCIFVCKPSYDGACLSSTKAVYKQHSWLSVTFLCCCYFCPQENAFCGCIIRWCFCKLWPDVFDCLVDLQGISPRVEFSTYTLIQENTTPYLDAIESAYLVGIFTFLLLLKFLTNRYSSFLGKTSQKHALLRVSMKMECFWIKT